jgi:hypothetical protein
LEWVRIGGIFALQIGPPTGSIDPFIGWIVGLVWVALTGAIGMLWRQSVAESKRKDELIDRLLNAELTNAKANEQSVSLLAQERRHMR